MSLSSELARIYEAEIIARGEELQRKIEEHAEELKDCERMIDKIEKLLEMGVIE